MKKILFFLSILLSSITYSQNRDYLMAENYFSNNEFEKASLLYNKLANRSVYNTNYLNKLLICYQELNKYSKVDSYLNNRLKKYPNMVYLNVFLGNNCNKQKDTIKAKNFFNKAIQGISRHPSYGISVAEMFKKIEKLDYAIKALQITAKIKKINLNIEIADLYGQQGKIKQMFNAYFNYLDINKGNNIHLIQYKTAPFLSDEKTNPNNILFKKALLKRSASNPKPEWNKLLAWIFTKQKEYKKAFIQLKALYIRKQQSLYGIKQFAKDAFNDKAFDASEKAFLYIKEKSENTNEKINAIYNIFKIAIAKKQVDINDKYNVIIDTYKINRNTIPVQLAYADYILLEKKDFIKAKELLKQALEVSSSVYQKANIKLKLGDILVFQNKFNKALIYYTQIQTKFQNHEIGQKARLKIATTSYFKGDFKWAKIQLKVLKKSASQLIANDAADLFITISDNAPKDSIPTGLLKFAKANLLSFQNKNKEAIRLLEEISSKFKGQEIEDEALFETAKIYDKLNDYDKAILNYKKVIELNNKGIFVDDSIYFLAEIYAKINNNEEAKKYYEKILIDYQSSIYLVEARKKFRKLRGDKNITE